MKIIVISSRDTKVYHKVENIMQQGDEIVLEMNTTQIKIHKDEISEITVIPDRS